MTVHVWDSRLTYVSVPKCACGSLKRFFYELLRGERFVPQWFRPSVHWIYPSRRFSALPHGRIAGHWRVAVVRDPLSRVVSGYFSKIVRLNCLEEPSTRLAVRAAGLPTRPTLEGLLANLARYKLVSRVIRTHFRPLSHYLGTDPSWYSRIYDISEVGDLADDACARTGRTALLPHVGRNKNRAPGDVVTPAVIARVQEEFREDVALYGAFFAPAEEPQPDRGATRRKKQGGHHG
jgi:hypothetical protein